ncbi:unnamed protein product [Schistosoma haematobium]|nr:unnamed protein product [Schistosoma haematobium]
MSENHSNQLSRLFYPINERVGLSIGVISGHQSKHKRKHLVFTISLTKPTSIQVYLVKITDKNEIKKVQVCNAKNLKKIDCRDTKTQPSYELQIITENKIWVFNALKLEEKRHFVSSFCRTLATLLPHVIKDIELVNFPQDINISPLSQHETLDALLNPEYMSTVGTGGDEDNVDGDEKSVDKDKSDVNAPVTDSYRSLTKREEDDIRQFLDELDEESTLLNAAQLTERLQEQLAHIEGTNVHSIMSSESQVLSLMTTLDSAIERAELLEKQLNIYYSFLEMYIEKSQNFFKRQIQEVLKCTQDSVANLVRPGKSKEIQRLENIPSDVGSVMSLHNLDSNLLTQVESIFDSCFDKILTLIRTEQAFLNQFFGFHLNASQIEKSHNTVMYKNYKGDELSTLFDCMVHLFDSVEQDVLNLITHCEQLQAILIMPLLITISRITENEITSTSSSSLSSPSQQTTTTNLDNSNSSNGIGNTSQLQLESQDSDKIPMTYIANFLSRLTIETKRAFNRLVERLIISFKTSKPCKKVRCGVLSMVRTYIEFAECSMTVFAKSSRLVDLERAHRELVRCLMTEIDRVASRSVKTPGEVVQLENYHRLCDILRRLKMSSLDDYRQDAKNRYTLALQEYTKTCMGRPLEKLASFFENVQSALDAGVRSEVVSYQFAFSKQELRKVIKEYPGKEVKHGLESLCKKVEKHLSDEENLFPVVWRSIQTEFITQCLRFSNLIQQCYPDSGIQLEFTITDLQNYFTEIACSR